MTKQDIEQMMSLWAPNATVTIGPGRTATGTGEIREAWMTSDSLPAGDELGL